MKLLLFILSLIATCLASFYSDQNRLENALDQLGVFAGKKLLDHFEFLRTQAVPITNDCYNTTLNSKGDKVNIFKENLRNVVKKYFNVFPNRLSDLSDEKYVQRVNILIDNLAEFAKKIYQCENSKKKYAREQNQKCITSMSSLSKNEFSRLSNDALTSKYFQPRENVPYSKKCEMNAIVGEPLAPDAYNWHTEGYVSPVKNQGKCNTCFIFASIAAAESAWYRFKGKNTGEQFSEQAILNCMYEGTETDPEEDLCQDGPGGFPGDVLDFMFINGLTLLQNEPYMNKTEHCKNYPIAAKPVTYCWNKYVNDEILKRHLFRNGPLAVTVDSSNLVNLCPGQSYKGPCIGKQKHAVLLIGYDNESWYFKNSWGDDIHHKGFFKMSRDNKLCEKCLIYNELGVPLFEL